MGSDWVRNRRRERIIYLPVDAEGSATPGIPITLTQFRTSESADAQIYPFSSFTQGTTATIPVPAGNSLLVIKANSSRYYQVIHARNASSSDVTYTVPGTITNYIYKIYPNDGNAHLQTAASATVVELNDNSGDSSVSYVFLYRTFFHIQA